jgi:hypothetical protein
MNEQHIGETDDARDRKGERAAAAAGTRTEHPDPAGIDAKGNGASHTDADTDENDVRGAPGDNAPDTYSESGDGNDGNNDADEECVDDTPFVLAKREMWAKLMLFRDGHNDWDANSVMAHVAAVVARFKGGRVKVSKAHLEGWTRDQLKLLAPLRDRTTRPIPEIDDKPENAQPDERGKPGEEQQPSGKEADDNPLAAFDRAVEELRLYIDRHERGEISRQAVITAARAIAGRHCGVGIRELTAWARDEIERGIIKAGAGALGEEKPDPAAVPDSAAEQQALLDAAWARCQAIALDPVRLLLDIAERLGVVGDRFGVVAVFLTMTSRLLTRPAGLLRKGASASGKSFPIDALIALFNKDIDYIEMTGASARALPYDERHYVHRVVLIGEATALMSAKNGDETFVGIFREMISKMRITYQTVEKVGDGKNTKMITRTIEKPGPIAVITTAAREIVEEEMNTRMLSSLADETEKQTQAVVKAIGEQLSGNARPRPDDDELACWRAFQDWLRLGPREVVVPYAGALSKLVDTKSLRIRRDFGAVCALIQASALVNRARRQLDPHDRIIAELEDYKWVLEALTGLDELRYGNVEHINQVRQVVVEAIDRRRRSWRRSQTLARCVTHLANHCTNHHLPKLAKQVRNAGKQAADEEHRGFRKFRELMTNQGKDPTWGGIGKPKLSDAHVDVEDGTPDVTQDALKTAAHRVVREAWWRAAQQVRDEMAAQLERSEMGVTSLGGSGPPEVVELSYAQMAGLLGITYKVARSRLRIAIENGAVVTCNDTRRPNNAPSLLIPGKVATATGGTGRGAFPSLRELSEKIPGQHA